MYASDYRREEIISSGIPTVKLVELALTLPVMDIGNELFGRSHAYFSIAGTSDESRVFLAGHSEEEQRRMSANALGMAGYDPGTLPEPEQPEAS